LPLRPLLPGARRVPDDDLRLAPLPQEAGREGTALTPADSEAKHLAQPPADEHKQSSRRGQADHGVRQRRAPRVTRDRDAEVAGADEQETDPGEGDDRDEIDGAGATEIQGGMMTQLLPAYQRQPAAAPSGRIGKAQPASPGLLSTPAQNPPRPGRQQPPPAPVHTLPYRPSAGGGPIFEPLPNAPVHGDLSAIIRNLALR